MTERSTGVLKVIAVVLNVVLAVVYPLAIWFALAHYSPRTVGILVAATIVPIMIVRHHDAPREHLWAVMRIPLVVVAVLAAGIVFDDARFLLMVPVLINTGLLITFGASLGKASDMPIIERFARMQEPELSDDKQRHCRQATVAWCVFFVLNASAAAVLALAAPVSWWATYNGGIAYALIGCMFVGEYIVRKYRFRDYGRGPHDRLLAVVFPPRGEL